MIYSNTTFFQDQGFWKNHFIVNLLQVAQTINSTDAVKIESVRKGEDCHDKEFLAELVEKGYVTDESAEGREFRRKYLDFIDAREKDEIQIFFVTNYSCNFACSYCYQDQYQNPGNSLDKEVIDAFFSYLKKEFSTRRKYVTIFGGEPLLSSPGQKEKIAYFIDKANAADLSLCFVTNGYFLEEYIPFLKKGKIREIQVTLDGIESMHNTRRFLKGGGGTFSKIVDGIDACLENSIEVNLRMVIDKENLAGLSDLAHFAIDRGWTGSRYFKTHVGRNYELHHCQSS